MGKKKVNPAVFEQMSHKKDAVLLGKAKPAVKPQPPKNTVTQHRSMGRGK